MRPCKRLTAPFLRRGMWWSAGSLRRINYDGKSFRSTPALIWERISIFQADFCAHYVPSKETSTREHQKVFFHSFSFCFFRPRQKSEVLGEKVFRSQSCFAPFSHPAEEKEGKNHFPKKHSNLNICWGESFSCFCSYNRVNFFCCFLNFSIFSPHGKLSSFPEPVFLSGKAWQKRSVKINMMFGFVCFIYVYVVCGKVNWV